MSCTFQWDQTFGTPLDSILLWFCCLAFIPLFARNQRYDRPDRNTHKSASAAIHEPFHLFRGDRVFAVGPVKARQPLLRCSFITVSRWRVVPVISTSSLLSFPVWCKNQIPQPFNALNFSATKGRNLTHFRAIHSTLKALYSFLDSCRVKFFFNLEVLAFLAAHETSETETGR